jgi:phospholipid transport system transporter-binding protein
LSQFEKNGSRLRVSGAVTVESVNTLLNECTAAFAADRSPADLSGTNLEMDLSGVTEADSSAIALLFEWLRRARGWNASLVFTNMPANLVTLAALYGVVELIPQQSSH